MSYKYHRSRLLYIAHIACDENSRLLVLLLNFILEPRCIHHVILNSFHNGLNITFYDIKHGLSGHPEIIYLLVQYTV